MTEARLLRVAFWSGLMHTLTAAAKLASTVRVRSFVCQLKLRRWESLREVYPSRRALPTHQLWSSSLRKEVWAVWGPYGCCDVQRVFVVLVSVFFGWLATSREASEAGHPVDGGDK